MKEFRFEPIEGIFACWFKEAGFKMTYFDYAPLLTMVYMRGKTSDNRDVFLVLSTDPDDYLSDGIFVLNEEEYIEGYEKYKNDPEFDMNDYGGGPDAEISSYINMDELEKIIRCIPDVSWEEFKEVIFDAKRKDMGYGSEDNA